MLLKHLYDFAVSRDLLEDPAFRRKTPVRWIIHLDTSGNLVGQGPQETAGSKKNKGRDFDVPKTTRATNSGTVADFLVDDIGAIFGLVNDPSKEKNDRAAAKLVAKNEDFWNQVHKACKQTGYRCFDALTKFHKDLGNNPPPFLRINNNGNGWNVVTASGQEITLGSDLFTFSVEEWNLLFQDERIRDYWRSVHAAEVESTEASAVRGTCIITGKSGVSLARTHTPMVTGIPKPAKSSGAGVVGFESDSFRSYGFEKSYNAPTSISASRGYLLALQYLSKSQDHWMSIGSAWLCFWAVKTNDANSVFTRLLRTPDPLTVRKFFKSPWSGLEQEPLESDKFIAATFTAAGPRIVVKAWVQMPLNTVVENFRRWFSDLQIVTGRTEEPFDTTTEVDTYPPLAVKRLASCTAPLTKKGGSLFPDEEKLRVELVTQLYRAALEGSAPSTALLKPILHQLHSKLVRDEHYKPLYDLSRFALLKLILNRNRNEQIMEIKEELTAETHDPAYNCGRLLALLNETQKKAHEYQLKGATIVEKYFGTASTSPGYVLPYLLKLNRHHLGKIAKSEKYAGDERFMESAITSILALFQQTEPMKQQGIAPAFPRTLDLQAQGRFALGFYQQMAADAKARTIAKAQQESNKK